jgi:methylenetetrahydrofolate--tRNA-(uracil-5-)-methyltransferase
MKPTRVNVIGAGLAGSEAAIALAEMGYDVLLYEMRPIVMTPAHKTGRPAELVCSNSMGAIRITAPKGLLLWEALMMGAVLPRLALENRVKAGKALAVDREKFSLSVDRLLNSHDRVQIIRQEVTDFDPNLPTIVAAGPLASAPLVEYLKGILGEDLLHFYDAVAPTIIFDTIDMSYAFWGDRYGKVGEGDYINIPLTEEEYNRFVDMILEARRHIPHDFENLDNFFERCLPIEEIARRGKLALAYGPMRPVGLVDPRTGKQPFAVIQLRRENKEGTLWGMVGFQTGLAHPDQLRIFRSLPALRHAEFARLGQIHRNTFVNAPKVLGYGLSLKKYPNVLLAGQLSGTEGYLEAIVGGRWAAVQLDAMLRGLEIPAFPKFSMWFGLLRHLHDASVDDFQPMGANFGLLPLPNSKMRKRERRLWQVRNALVEFLQWLEMARRKGVKV